MTWLEPIADGGSPVVNYHVYQDGVLITPPDTGTGGLSEWTSTSVSPGVSYDFSVAAINGRGEGAQSSPAVAIIAATVPTKPLNVRKASATTGIITIEWDAPASDGDFPVTDYEVWWDDGAEDGNFNIIGASTGNALTFTTSTSLVVGNVYSFLIRAVNAVGESPYSDQFSVIAGTIPD